MNEEKIEKIEYATYDKLINIDLFNNIVAFIINTRVSKDSWEIFREMQEKCIWIKRKDNLNIQTEYQFQYFGELLERYEERIGNDIRDIRAIALALGYAKKLVENNMIIGTQLVDFLNKINSLAEHDIYLKAALYLYDNKKYYIYSEQLMNTSYTSTEDIIFALSIFYERIGDFFNHNKKQILDLLGKSRNMPVIGNIGIYAWVIKNLYLLISNDRKKEIALLKALIKVPTGLQKEDTAVYKELLNNGYSKEEIAYLNYLILYYNTVPKSVKLGYSIVEEKIAVNLCITLVNNEKSYEGSMYDLINNILSKYKTFDIKCYGYCNIKDAIKDKINISNPITLAKLYGAISDDVYSFNILDEKWDIVANMVDSEIYQEIFDKFLLRSNYNKEKMNECIKRYNELTNKEYIKSFFKKDWNRNSVFSILVENNVILLKDMFELILAENNQKRDNHLENYIKGVNNKKSFEFLQYLLRLNQYSIIEISDFGFDFKRLVDGYMYSDHRIYGINIERKFLNKKGHKILFGCLEKFIFYCKPDKYLRFLEVALRNNVIRKSFKKKELRQLYVFLRETYPEIYNTNWFQEMYLTAEECSAIREQKRIEKQLKEQKELSEIREAIIKRFNEMDEKNSFEKLYMFCDKYQYNEEKMKICIEKVREYIIKNINLFNKEIREIRYFMKILELFMKQQELTYKEYAKITYEYIKGEVQNDKYINATCQYSNENG